MTPLLLADNQRKDKHRDRQHRVSALHHRVSPKVMEQEVWSELFLKKKPKNNGG
jgi:hypothetical protein